MRILLATGVYPPALGGPSQYAKNLYEEWTRSGHEVRVMTYRTENKLPTGIRHLYYLFKIFPSVIWSDFVLALDTYSVGLPAAVASKLCGKKFIIRTGGDFLWEGYVERTGDRVYLSEFYTASKDRWNLKERTIFRLTRWTLHCCSALIFSTDWQKDIWFEPYELKDIRLARVENYYGTKEGSTHPKHKIFLGGTRKLVWKNIEVLQKVFKQQNVHNAGAILDINNYPYDEFMSKIASSYAVVLASLGDISPNMILDAIRHNKPFIITEENGLLDRIGDIAIEVDPKDEADLANKVLWLCDTENYYKQKSKIEAFNFVHTWSDIANEIIDICKKG